MAELHWTGRRIGNATAVQDIMFQHWNPPSHSFLSSGKVEGMKYVIRVWSYYSHELRAKAYRYPNKSKAKANEEHNDEETGRR